MHHYYDSPSMACCAATGTFGTQSERSAPVQVTSHGYTGLSCSEITQGPKAHGEGAMTCTWWAYYAMSASQRLPATGLDRTNDGVIHWIIGVRGGVVIPP